MIEKITLKAGRTPEQIQQEITIAPINIFVGPNNSGKSRALSEIEGWCRNSQPQAPKLISSIKFKELSEIEIDKLLKEIIIDDGIEEPGKIKISVSGYTTSIHRQTFINLIKYPNDNKISYCQEYVQLQTMSLNGRNRTSLVEDQQAGNLHERPTSSFQRLLISSEKRNEIRRITKESFDSYFILDPTHGGKLRIRLSEHAPHDSSTEVSLTEDAIKFQAAAELISDASDGIKAFTGIITELIAGDPKIIFIDEPEAFLHPALAQNLGLEISKLSTEHKKQAFISTHSPFFLMGCINSGAPINIIRLTYRDKVATSRLLESHDILKLMRSSLLRSSGVLAALFYESVIVTESDNDRAFYQEINERLLRYKPEWGIQNCLFLNAQNKQTIPAIIGPLRQLGIAAAGIVDIDVVKDGGQNWAKFLKSINIPALSHDQLASARNAVKKALNDTGLNMKTDGGINILNAEDKESAKDLLNHLGNYGMFVIPGGEVESFLKETNAPGHGTQWLISVFEAMGDTPDCENYMYPRDSDVWEFIGEVKKWLVNARRKGIPS